MGSVLVIEDDEEFRDHLVHLLRRRGHEVITADHGGDALAKLKKHIPSLILLDLMMPEMDGWMFRARTMSEPALAAIPIVVLSGVASLETEWRKLGVIDHVGKPVNLDKLYKIVDFYAAN